LIVLYLYLYTDPR